MNDESADISRHARTASRRLKTSWPKGSRDNVMTVMQSQTRTEALNRLRYIEGHLAAVRRMVEEERHCVDVLEQSHAVRRAMQKFEAVLLDGHLHTCVAADVRSGEDEAVVAELLRFYELANR